MPHKVVLRIKAARADRRTVRPGMHGGDFAPFMAASLVQRVGDAGLDKVRIEP
jgi:hypothetical protein